MQSTLFSLVLTILFSLFSMGLKTLDKGVAIIDDRIITQSEIDNVKKNLSGRREISPYIYPTDSLTTEELIHIQINQEMIRKKLKEIGFEITDDQVNAQIGEHEKRLKMSNPGYNRRMLVEFLKGKSMSFEEYFELIRQTMEYSTFRDRVITPLISITDQQLKNYYFAQNQSSVMDFIYTLTSFSVDLSNIPLEAQNKKELIGAMNSFLQSPGPVRPTLLKNMEENEIEGVAEKELANAFVLVLKNTEEGSTTPVLEHDGKLFAFYVKKKDLKESTPFLQVKERLRMQLFEQEAAKELNRFLDQEKHKFHIKIL